MTKQTFSGSDARLRTSPCPNCTVEKTPMSKKAAEHHKKA